MARVYWDNQAANAQLIVAAPDLLAALKMCLQAALASASDPMTRLDAVAQFAVDAIAKAEAR